MSAACRLAVAATAVVVVGGCRSKPGPRVSLRYHPPTGATFHYTLEQQNSVKMEGGPMAQLPGQEITLHIYYSQAVTGPTTGGIGVTVTYDSTTMVPAGMAPALDRMRGLTSKVVYDDRMHVVSASFSGIEGQQSPVVEQMGNSVRGMTVPLPEGPVGVGDSWSSETELPIAARLGASAPLKARTKHTLKAIQVAGAEDGDRPTGTRLGGLSPQPPGNPARQPGDAALCRRRTRDHRIARRADRPRGRRANDRAPRGDGRSRRAPDVA